jgi:hypothetical protein
MLEIENIYMLDETQEDNYNLSYGDNILIQNSYSNENLQDERSRIPAQILTPNVSTIRYDSALSRPLIVPPNQNLDYSKTGGIKTAGKSLETNGYIGYDPEASQEWELIYMSEDMLGLKDTPHNRATKKYQYPDTFPAAYMTPDSSALREAAGPDRTLSTAERKALLASEAKRKENEKKAGGAQNIPYWETYNAMRSQYRGAPTAFQPRVGADGNPETNDWNSLVNAEKEKHDQTELNARYQDIQPPWFGHYFLPSGSKDDTMVNPYTGIIVEGSCKFQVFVDIAPFLTIKDGKPLKPTDLKTQRDAVLNQHYRDVQLHYNRATREVGSRGKSVDGQYIAHPLYKHHWNGDLRNRFWVPKIPLSIDPTNSLKFANSHLNMNKLDFKKLSIQSATKDILLTVIIASALAISLQNNPIAVVKGPIGSLLPPFLSKAPKGKVMKGLYYLEIAEYGVDSYKRASDIINDHPECTSGDHGCRADLVGKLSEELLWNQPKDYYVDAVADLVELTKIAYGDYEESEIAKSVGSLYSDLKYIYGPYMKGKGDKKGRHAGLINCARQASRQPCVGAPLLWPYSFQKNSGDIMDENWGVQLFNFKSKEQIKDLIISVLSLREFWTQTCGIPVATNGELYLTHAEQHYGTFETASALDRISVDSPHFNDNNYRTCPETPWEMANRGEYIPCFSKQVDRIYEPNKHCPKDKKIQTFIAMEFLGRVFYDDETLDDEYIFVGGGARLERGGGDVKDPGGAPIEIEKSEGRGAQATPLGNKRNILQQSFIDKWLGKGDAFYRSQDGIKDRHVESYINSCKKCGIIVPSKNLIDQVGSKQDELEPHWIYKAEKLLGPDATRAGLLAAVAANPGVAAQTFVGGKVGEQIFT